MFTPLMRQRPGSIVREPRDAHRRLRRKLLRKLHPDERAAGIPLAQMLAAPARQAGRKDVTHPTFSGPDMKPSPDNMPQRSNSTAAAEPVPRTLLRPTAGS